MQRMFLLSAVVALAGLSACRTTMSEPQRASAADPRTSPVPTHHPFEAEGTVSSVGSSALAGMVGGNNVVISRKDAPDVQLHVTEKTQVMLDNRPARLTDLHEGDQVRAMFDFDGDKPVAIDIVAKEK